MTAHGIHSLRAFVRLRLPFPFSLLFFHFHFLAHLCMIYLPSPMKGI